MGTTLLKSASSLPWHHWDRGIIAITVAFLLCMPLLTPRIYAVDSVEYYVYIRSLFFDGDLDFTNEYTRFHELNPRAGSQGRATRSYQREYRSSDQPRADRHGNPVVARFFAGTRSWC